MPTNFFSRSRVELIFALYVALLMGIAIWRNWSSPILTVLYIASAAILLAMLIRARKINIPEAYVSVANVAFVIFILDSFITLMRLR